MDTLAVKDGYEKQQHSIFQQIYFIKDNTEDTTDTYMQKKTYLSCILTENQSHTASTDQSGNKSNQDWNMIS